MEQQDFNKTMFYSLKMTILEGNNINNLFKKECHIKLCDITEDNEINNQFYFNIINRRYKQFRPDLLNEIQLNHILPFISICDRPGIAVMMAYEILQHKDDLDNLLKKVFIENNTYNDFIEYYEKIWDEQKIRDQEIRKKVTTDNYMDIKEFWKD